MRFVQRKYNNQKKTYLDRRVAGSFITITSVMSPYLLKYSRKLSETHRKKTYI